MDVEQQVRLDEAVADLAQAGDLASKADRGDSCCGVVGILLDPYGDDAPASICHRRDVAAEFASIVWRGAGQL